MNSLILQSFVLLHLVTPNVEMPKADPLTEYINELAVFECRNCPAKYDRVDSNGELSYSCMQFQEITFREQVAKYDMLPDIEPHEIGNFIYDCSFQKKVVRKMIENDPNYWRHWRTSIITRKLGKYDWNK